MRVTRSMTRAGVASLSTALGPSIPVIPLPESKRAHKHVPEKDLVGTTIPSGGICNGVPSPSRIADDILAKNKLLLLQLEQSGALAPGVVTMEASGELQANLCVQPDTGTMAGLYPAMAPPPDFDSQIPSWLRDYLVKELDTHGHGPPAVCRVLYEGLKRSQDEVGTNPSVGATEGLLAYAVISLQRSIDEIRDFVGSSIVVEGDYERELEVVTRTTSRLVGGEDGELPRDIKLLFELGSMSATLKSAMDDPLENLVISPLSQLVEKIEGVGKALRQEVESAELDSQDSNSDSGISGIDDRLI